LNATGDETLAAGSTFEAEVGGVTAGNGASFHDQFNVTGTVDLGSGASLVVKQYGTFTSLARGDVLTVIKATGGISGAFADMTNNDFDSWILFDNNSDITHEYGNVIGTGLTESQTFADYTSNANRAAIAGSVWATAVTEAGSSSGLNRAGFIDSNTNAGKAVLAIIKATPGTQTDAVLDSLSPEAFAGLSDYILTTARTVTDSALSQSTMAKSGNWSVGAGFAHAENNYKGSTSAALNRNLSSETAFVALSYQCDPNWKVGFFYGSNTGNTKSTYSSTEFKGDVLGLTLDGTIPFSTPVLIKAAIAQSNIKFDTRRTSILGVSGDESIDSSTGVSTSTNSGLKSVSAQISASMKFAREDGLSISPVLGLVYGRSTSDAFAEAGTGLNLDIDEMTNSSTRLILGASLGYYSTADTALSLSVGLEKQLGSVARSVNANLDGNAFSIVDAGDDGIVTNIGLGASVGLGNDATFNLGAEFRAGNNYTGDRRINASFNKRF
jgi:hypothetical protein